MRARRGENHLLIQRVTGVAAVAAGRHARGKYVEAAGR